MAGRTPSEGSVRLVYSAAENPRLQWKGVSTVIRSQEQLSVSLDERDYRLVWHVHSGADMAEAGLLSEPAALKTFGWLSSSPAEAVEELRVHLNRSAQSLQDYADARRDTDLGMLAEYCGRWLESEGLPILDALEDRASWAELDEQRFELLREAIDGARELLDMASAQLTKGDGIQGFHSLLNWITEIPHALNSSLDRLLATPKRTEPQHIVRYAIQVTQPECDHDESFWAA